MIMCMRISYIIMQRLDDALYVLRKMGHGTSVIAPTSLKGEMQQASRPSESEHGAEPTVQAIGITLHLQIFTPAAEDRPWL